MIIINVQGKESLCGNIRVMEKFYGKKTFLFQRFRKDNVVTVD